MSLDIDEGEFTALLGPSGSGKTTLLRIIAGLEFPDRGSVWFGEQDVTDASAASRGIGFVFQHYALFGHMTVAENIAFGLSVMKRSQRPSPRGHSTIAWPSCSTWSSSPGIGGAIPASCRAASGSASRWPARSPAIRGSCCSTSRSARSTPRFGGSCGPRCGKSTTGLKLTSIFVTHDQEEAFALADRVAVLHDGRLAQVDAPRELQARPQSTFVREFIE